MFSCSLTEIPEGEDPGVLPYPPVLGAHDQERALGEGAEGNALAVLAVDGLGFLLKHWGGVLNQTEPTLNQLLPAQTELRTVPEPRQKGLGHFSRCRMADFYGKPKQSEQFLFRYSS